MRGCCLFDQDHLIVSVLLLACIGNNADDYKGQTNLLLSQNLYIRKKRIFLPQRDQLDEIIPLKLSGFMHSHKYGPFLCSV